MSPGSDSSEGHFAVDVVNNGRFVFVRSDDYDFSGAFSGTGALDKMGAGVLSFTGDYGFDGVTNIFAGSVRIGGLIDPETEFNVGRSEEHTSELQSLMRISYAVFCLKKKKDNK